MTKRALGAPIITVGGGKGGVGKSVVACNLAAAIARSGFRTALVDADLGAGNLHTLLGIHHPKHTLHDFVDRSIDSLELALTPTSVSRLYLVPGRTAVPGGANPQTAQKTRLLRAVQALEVDAIVVDVGAGTGHTAIDFFTVADHRIGVATPQLTSVQNAYGFFKAAVWRSARGLAVNANEQAAFDAAVDGREVERVGELVGKLRPEQPAYAKHLETYLATFGATLIGNQLELPAQRNVLHALSRMLSDFLMLDVPVAACLRHRPDVHRAVTDRRLPIFAGDDPEGGALERLVETLLSGDVAELRRARLRAKEERPRTLDSQRELLPLGAAPPTPPPVPVAAESTPEVREHIGKFLRRHERFGVHWSGRVAGADGRPRDCAVLDVSIGGASLLVEVGETPLGDTVSLEVPAVAPLRRVTAIVRRFDARARRLAIEFAPPLAAETGEELVRVARHGVPRPVEHADPLTAAPAR